MKQFGHLEPVRICDCCAKHLSRDDIDCISRVIPCLCDGLLKREAVREILEFISRDAQHGEEAVLAGVIQPLLEILSSPIEMTTNPDLVVDAVRILAKLSEDSQNARILAESTSALSQMAMLLSSYNETIRLQAALILAHLSKLEENRAKIREVGALRALISCIDEKISNISDISGEVSVQRQALQEWSLAAIEQLAQG